MEIKELEKYLQTAIQKMSDDILRMDDEGEYDHDFESYLRGRLDSYTIILDRIKAC